MKTISKESTLNEGDFNRMSSGGYKYWNIACLQARQGILECWNTTHSRFCFFPLFHHSINPIKRHSQINITIPIGRGFLNLIKYLLIVLFALNFFPANSQTSDNKYKE